MPNHLQGLPAETTPEPEGSDAPWALEAEEAWDEERWEPLVRPAWWRWVAIVLIVALVVATPLAYGLYWLLR